MPVSETCFFPPSVSISLLTTISHSSISSGSFKTKRRLVVVLRYSAVLKVSLENNDRESAADLPSESIACEI